MKLIGAAAVICAFTLAGFAVYASMRQRSRFWENFITALELIKAEIGFSGSGLKEAFIRASDISREPLFLDAAEEIERLGFDKAWESAVKKRALCEKDFETLMLLSAKLGKTDVRGQIQHIEYIQKLADEVRQRADLLCRHEGMLFQRGGILAGILAALILM